MTDRAADLDALGRVAANHDVLALLRDRSSQLTWSDFGDDWVGADAWPADLPLEVGTDRVRAWLRAPFLVSKLEVAG
ncbi:MAG TPA: hypothetical protein VMQ65_01985 [Candidatus Limnocylindria bacterium]|nr:hypothetical protein [Candidatus Limnocylindria bacterium]